jgi:hypothetical protein
MPLISSFNRKAELTSDNSFGLPAFWLLDRVGRATMLLLDFVPMFVLMLAPAFSFKDGPHGDAHVALVGTFGLLFFVAYSPTAGTSPFRHIGRGFPLGCERSRAFACGSRQFHRPWDCAAGFPGPFGWIGRI